MFPLDQFLSAKELAQLKNLSYRQLMLQFITAAYSIMSTYMLWKAIGLFLNNDSPIVVVLSESMEPGFKRGDILFLKPKEWDIGDMTVFQINKNEIPIVHRAIKILDGKTLTKGDNNRRDDVPLYRPGQYLLEREDIISTVFGYIPYFGMITIWINTLPWLKSVLLFLIGLSVFVSRE
ncbi:Signal peptidase I [Pseudoloma neurophilia]|uniref:Signal peptidase complex catalytic subunit SEC11 n=1 Tax=Pseudoloma neurophilia TaxID=146866 RepID=A0A0R0LZZ8_9MICR|nr:Signal peptidase I [Pseudoloma neurophilia]